jgi:hypothetical protein
MLNTNSRKLCSAALMMSLTLTGALLAGSAEPAMAMCKYGGPNCVHNSGPPKFPSGTGAAWPVVGEDPDCQQYSNCGLGSNNWGDPAKFKRPTGGTPVGHGTTAFLKLR